jgi:dipeptidyl aminopeptidase/acylaminoacyl peptidase
MNDGHVQLVLDHARGHITAAISPHGTYVVYYDPSAKGFYSYTVATGARRNVSVHLPAARVDGEETVDDGVRLPAAWLADDSAALLYDRYDIWEVDLTGHRPPRNLTNGYGRAHHIEFRLADRDQVRVGPHDSLLLVATDLTTQDRGFFRTAVDQPGNPVRLSMGRWAIDLALAGLNLRAARAKHAELYSLMLDSAATSHNVYLTTDFRTFTPLTHSHPEQAYNWFTTELHTWEAPDGRRLQGVLYKPENFDPRRKYPLILLYYERFSHTLNEYLEPDASGAQINVPYYVSRGYLIFSPDIHYTLGRPGPSAFNAVVSAARYLAKIPWVDASRIGLQGHSWGGYQTNYILTHTSMFAAAVSGAGMSDLVSEYGGQWPYNGASYQGYIESGQGRMGVSLWQRPDLYIAGSPIFRADRVTTPVLMMANKTDRAVLPTQGLELFTALRRLGRRAWLLRYDDGDHWVTNRAASDWTMRMAQFFDHYLKGAAPPKWMTDGVPARLKGVESGLELDTSGKEPGTGLASPTVCAATARPARRADAQCPDSGRRPGD